MKSPTDTPHFLGLRTAIHYAPDLAKAKSWYSRILGLEPYFIGGYELGLDPDPSSSENSGGVVVYWGVSDANAALKRLLSIGAAERTNVQDIGEGIRVATVLDPFGNNLGVIENPHFKLPSA